MQKVQRTINGKELVLETGLMAKQASGSVLVRYGDISILCPVTGSKKTDLSMDFFPLTVNYNEKYYAGGKIPGGFFKREAKPRDKEVLTSRIIDRPIRPLFPDGMRNEVQVIPTVLSTDQEQPTDIFALIAASAALSISWIPFEGPIAAVRVGMIEGEFVLNPTYEQLEESTIDMIIAGSKDAILMIEGEAKEIQEADFIRAIEYAHKEMQPIIEMQEELVELVKPEKHMPELYKINEELREKVVAFAREKMTAASSNPDKAARNDAVEAVTEETKTHFEEEGVDEELLPQIGDILHDLEKEIVRDEIVNKDVRPDGRAMDEIRMLDVQTEILPRVHGSALFTRGQTQSLAVVTLGSTKDAQLIDDIDGNMDKTFLLHYNFPPFSVGETGRYGPPGRREIGHGNLAERSFYSILPPPEEFPYTIRIVSEILESNGSSSMATVCASSLALLSAGVPIKQNVAGIAMGLTTQDDKYKILTDIQGVEDHLGDMDFKVAGTREGITAFQLDIKLKGISSQILSEALGKAKDARTFLLDKMDSVIAQAGDIADTAPKLKIIKISTDRIKDLIGPQGKNIKSIVEETGSSIDIEDDGTVNIFAKDQAWMDTTLELVEQFTKEPEIGEEYEGIVKSVKDFGAFVEIFPGLEGMCHVSELDYKRVESVADYVNVGDVLKVKVLDMRDGRIALSHKATMPVPEGYVERERSDRGGRSGGSGGGGRDRDRGGRGGGGGGRDRGGRGGGGRDRDRGGRDRGRR